MKHMAIYLMLTLLAACSSSDSSTPVKPVDPAVSGLNARPANTSCIAPARPLQNASYALTNAFPGVIFTRPVLVLQAPGENGRMFVLEQSGRIFTVNSSGTPVATLFADLRNIVDSGPNEAGLLGMAFHPDYASNGLVFLSYTTSDNPVGDSGINLRSRISRFNVASDHNSLNMASERNLIDLAQPYSNHNGGNIAFHPTEGYLYIGFGDGGSGGDPENRAQNTAELFGKILRIDVNVSDLEWNAGTHYKIPAGNPYAAGGGRAEIYALGMRNPWRWSFDRQSGELWAGDVGQDRWEEIDKIVVGGNYGWRQREGAHCYNPASACQTTGLIDPVAEYDHSSGRCSVTGGYVYRGNAITALRGQYLYGDYCSGEIWAIPTATANSAPQLLLDSSQFISSFGEDAAGEIYVVSHSSGMVYRLVASGGTPGGVAVPAQLSQTGCVASGNPTQPVTGLVPYDINVPFWSDGLAKERYLSVPDGSSIALTGEGRLAFPVGSVLMKNFRQNGTLIETRLLMHHPDGVWAGYSYEWNAGQTDATLVTTTTTKSVNGQTWTFLQSADCMRCHTDSAVFALGTEIPQLNRNFTYPGTGRTRNQLATLEAVGLFSADMQASPANLAALPSPSDTTRTLTERARAYLHANCSSCHRPGGGTPASIDLRYDTALASSGACATPILGNLGIPGANIIKSGSPATSVLYLRMNTRGTNQMPPLASALVDTNGAALISSWIQSLSSCP